MAGDSHSKTEKPSPRRLHKARTEGKFPTSREMVAATQFMVFIVIAVRLVPRLDEHHEGHAADLPGRVFSRRPECRYVSGLLPPRCSSARLFRCLSIGGLTCVLTLSVHLFVDQIRLQSRETHARFRPVQSGEQDQEHGVPGSHGATAGLRHAGAVLFGDRLHRPAECRPASLAAVHESGFGAPKVGGSIKDILWKAAALFLVFGLIDLFRQKRKFMKDLRMTKQEVKEESKRIEGNPLIKGKIRRLQRDLARRRMMQEVATATAVIVNPTHYAVAIRYDHETMATPMVVAKGKNYLALAHPADRALEHNIPLVENPPLAQALYKWVDVGREIPAHLYRAVAEVLAYIYRLTRGAR